MLEKPILTDDAIINCLNQQYHLAVVSLEFLPIGNDATAREQRQQITQAVGTIRSWRMRFDRIIGVLIGFDDVVEVIYDTSDEGAPN
jgi:hypothetical protein